MIYIEVALKIPLNTVFTYSYDPKEGDGAEQLPEVGKRVSVRFGNQNLTGFVVSKGEKISENCPVKAEKIIPIKKVLDKDPLFTKEIFEIAKWVSRYYLCTIGEAIFSIIPTTGKGLRGNIGFPFSDEFSENPSKELSEEQKEAAKSIIDSSIKGKADYHYIYGMTGSGKTEVFLQAAEHLLSKGKGVIYLVPEIGLTPQVVEAVVKRFGPTAAVIHSQLTSSQKMNEWHKIMKKEARIVVGARSAVFAPVPDLGLIIIDEEHDGSYKSGETPRYHARQVAMFRSSRLGIPLVMGSATPSAEAWKLMEEKKLIRHLLTKRLAGGNMPKIKIVDLSKSKNISPISKELEDEIRKTIENKKQAILFLNRRGFTHFFRCNTCGFEHKCKNCSVSMTYHKAENRLRCHYCGWSTFPQSQCPKCSSLDIGYSGFGTEYIEAETKAKFPEARILRIDTDSISKKGELQEKLDAFRLGEYDILLGTQMVAKGLNFPNLQLVGVILADTALHIPDFRAAERTFSLITQVSGRAGRFFPDGKVLVQTYNPLREPIMFSCSGKIEEFYRYELNQRKMLGFPPYSRLVRLVFRSLNRKKAEKSAIEAKKILSSSVGTKGEVIGPAECPIFMTNNNYRYQLLLRSDNIAVLQKNAENLLYNYTHAQSVYIECDVDPVSIM